MTNCKNCDFAFTGKYCNNCGQKAGVSELKLHDVVHETWHAITHTDNGILRLVQDLFVHPKSVYLNYFSGQRKKYFSPVTFFLVSAGLLLFLGTKVFDYQDYKLRTLDEFGRFVFTETKFITIILLPFEILITWLLFRKRYNLAKNIVFWLFLNGFLFTLKIIFTPFYFIFISNKLILDNVIVLIQTAFTFLHLVLVFGNRKWLNVIAIVLFTNLLFVSRYLLSGYLLFGEDIYRVTHAKTFIDLVLNAYKF